MDTTTTSTTTTTSMVTYSSFVSSLATAAATVASETTTTAAATSSSWRQYVPLVVIALVLLDIVSGSPVANGILNRAAQQTAASANKEEDANGDTTDTNNQAGVSIFQTLSGQTVNLNTAKKTNKERINVDQFAAQALERASSVTELRTYLETQKTDWDKMKDLQARMDQKMEQIDEKIQQRKIDTTS